MPFGAFFNIPGEPGQEPDFPPLEEEPEAKAVKLEMSHSLANRPLQGS